MEYILLILYTLISFIIGLLIGVLWLIKRKQKLFHKCPNIFLYILLSIIASTISILITSEMFNAFILNPKYYQFSIKNLVEWKSLYTIIKLFGAGSAFTTIITFIIGYLIRRK